MVEAFSHDATRCHPIFFGFSTEHRPNQTALLKPKTAYPVEPCTADMIALRTRYSEHATGEAHVSSIIATQREQAIDRREQRRRERA